MHPLGPMALYFAYTITPAACTQVVCRADAFLFHIFPAATATHLCARVLHPDLPTVCIRRLCLQRLSKMSKSGEHCQHRRMH